MWLTVLGDLTPSFDCMDMRYIYGTHIMHVGKTLVNIKYINKILKLGNAHVYTDCFLLQATIKIKVLGHSAIVPFLLGLSLYLIDSNTLLLSRICGQGWQTYNKVICVSFLSMLIQLSAFFEGC